MRFNIHSLLGMIPSNVLDVQPFYELAEQDPKTILLTLGKALMNSKIILCIACFIVSVYFFGYETVFVNSMNTLKQRDAVLAQQEQARHQKEDEQRQFEAWRNEVASVTTKIVQLKPEQSPKVIGLKESEAVVSIAKAGNGSFQEPNNTREGVVLTPVQDSTIDLATGAPPLAGANPGEKEGASGGGMMGSGSEGQQPVTIPLYKYEYKISVTGTYPAVVDFINRLVSLDKLISINEIDIDPVSKDMTARPDPTKFPEYPVKVTMTVDFSIFLYPPAGSAAN